jgi:hypothetical protein
MGKGKLATELDQCCQILLKSFLLAQPETSDAGEKNWLYLILLLNIKIIELFEILNTKHLGKIN